MNRAPRVKLPSTGVRQPVSRQIAVIGRSLTSDLPVLQAKLTVNPPGDRYEQEADRIADLIARMPEPSVQRAPT